MSVFPPPVYEVLVATLGPLVRSVFSIAHQSFSIARTSVTTVITMKVMPEIIYDQKDLYPVNYIYLIPRVWPSS